MNLIPSLHWYNHKTNIQYSLSFWGPTQSALVLLTKEEWKDGSVNYAWIVFTTSPYWIKEKWASLKRKFTQAVKRRKSVT